MLIRIDMSSEIPIYQQIRDQVVMGIGTGELENGELLPSVRVLADSIGVNFMTVNKAYNLLKQEGFIIVDRRVGAKVKEKSKDGLSQDYWERMKVLIAEGLVKSDGIDSLREGINKIISQIEKGGE